MKKIRKGDEVIVTTGKDKGRRGTVLQVFDDDRVLVEGVNLAKKHIKPNPNIGEAGGIRDTAMPMDISNVLVFNPKSKKGREGRFQRRERWRQSARLQKRRRSRYLRDR